MATAVELLTTDEYLARTWDERRTELIDGRIVVNEPTFAHQEVMFAVATVLKRWVSAGAPGTVSLPLDVPLEKRVTLAPDVLWFREPIPVDSARAPRMPDLAVEIRSPSTAQRDVGRKRELYERHGAQELWLVDHGARPVRALRRSRPGVERFDVDVTFAAADTLTSPLLPGFAQPVAELFAALNA
jgi:Uma2 family endonuclease